MNNHAKELLAAAVPKGSLVGEFNFSKMNFLERFCLLRRLELWHD